jgi:hypothetical protein
MPSKKTSPLRPKKRKINSSTELPPSVNDAKEEQVLDKNAKGIWQLFERKDKKHACCRLCKKNGYKEGLNVALSGNTTNMWNHSRTHHLRLYLQLKKQAKAIKAIKATKMRLLSSYYGPVVHSKTISVAKVRTLLQKWVVLDQQDFTVVESPSFKEFIDGVKKLGNEWIDIGADTLKNDIMESYQQKKDKLEELLKKNSSQVALTTDIWTSINMTPFMGITCHYIDDNWELQSVVLDFKAIVGSHTGKNIAREFSNTVYEDFQLRNKVSFK